MKFKTGIRVKITQPWVDFFYIILPYFILNMFCSTSFVLFVFTPVSMGFFFNLVIFIFWKVTCNLKKNGQTLKNCWLCWQCHWQKLLCITWWKSHKVCITVWLKTNKRWFYWRSLWFSKLWQDNPIPYFYFYSNFNKLFFFSRNIFETQIKKGLRAVWRKKKWN